MSGAVVGGSARGVFGRERRPLLARARLKRFPDIFPDGGQEKIFLCYAQIDQARSSPGMHTEDVQQFPLAAQ